MLGCCDCPVGLDCKHVVAGMLEWQRQASGDVQSRIATHAFPTGATILLTSDTGLPSVDAVPWPTGIAVVLIGGGEIVNRHPSQMNPGVPIPCP